MVLSSTKDSKNPLSSFSVLCDKVKDSARCLTGEMWPTTARASGWRRGGGGGGGEDRGAGEA